MQGERDKWTLGIALFITALAVIGNAYSLISVPLLVLAVFFMAWGRNQRRVESFVGSLWAGSYLLNFLHQVDLILSPRDQDYEQHIRMVIIGYCGDLRKALRILWATRNPYNLTSQQWEQFFKDCLVDSPSNNRGSVKPELRDVIGRVLDELGV